MDKTYEVLKGVAAMVDDVLVFGGTKQEHENLRARERRETEPRKVHHLRKRGQLFQSHTVTRRTKTRSTKTEGNPRHGATTEQGRALHLSEINAPHRQLLKLDSEFVWDTIMTDSFNK